MINDLGASKQRILAIVILLVAVLLISSVTIVPVVLANVRYQDDIEQLQNRLVRLQQISEHDDELKAQYAALRRTQSSRGYFLKGDSEAVASADLQRILKGVATANGTQLMSTQIMPATHENNLIRISLRVSVQGPLPGLVESLYAIEANSVLLFLDNVSVRPISLRRRRQADFNSQFEVAFDLIAYLSEAS